MEDNIESEDKLVALILPITDSNCKVKFCFHHQYYLKKLIYL